MWHLYDTQLLYNTVNTQPTSLFAADLAVHSSVTKPSTHNLLKWEITIRNSRGIDYEGFCGHAYDTV